MAWHQDLPGIAASHQRGSNDIRLPRESSASTRTRNYQQDDTRRACLRIRQTDSANSPTAKASGKFDERPTGPAKFALPNAGQSEI